MELTKRHVREFCIFFFLLKFQWLVATFLLLIRNTLTHTHTHKIEIDLFYSLLKDSFGCHPNTVWVCVVHLNVMYSHNSHLLLSILQFQFQLYFFFIDLARIQFHFIYTVIDHRTIYCDLLGRYYFIFFFQFNFIYIYSALSLSQFNLIEWFWNCDVNHKRFYQAKERERERYCVYTTILTVAMNAIAIVSNAVWSILCTTRHFQVQ